MTINPGARGVRSRIAIQRLDAIRPHRMWRWSTESAPIAAEGALTHDKCYRAGGRCLTKMLPVQNGQNGRQIEGATERGKQARTNSELGRTVREEHQEREAADP